MPCCGGQRSGMIRTTPEGMAQARAMPPIAFVYLGATSLSVIGGATGRAYRFAHNGATLDVHPRDAPGLAAIKSLQRAR
jgi:hypothetical protein